MTENKPKQVIILRTDLNMRKGKMAAQASHASMMFLVNKLSFYKHQSEIRNATREINHVWFNYPQTKWLFDGKFTKVVLGVDSEKALVDLYIQACGLPGTPAFIVEDEGLTEFHGVKTKTALAIGPGWSNVIDPLTKDLKLL